ncbi:hypothetical protein GTA08_BOTSDO12355 [Neofusicoccum parvum]|uniref:Uncharacterized protein n=1 Tax=Neofusicoccum parvum TaxID=310453 RepID=A0ACB5RQN8_9PEZI|nr:hypothetical protein GTA08_BOTSDO12355 [Neofusicoccum parvum]
MSGASENQHPALLKNTVCSLFNSELYSDIEVVFVDGERFKCHKLVLSQSRVLANTFNPMHNFKEAVDGVIKLTNDEPEPAKAMVQYLYTGSYSVCDDAPKSKDLLWHVSMYTMGEIYALPGLQELAMDRFCQVTIGGPSPVLNAHELTPAIREIYGSTPDSSRGMRKLAVLAIKKSGIDVLLMDEGFKEMVGEVGPFGKDLLLSLHPPPQDHTKAYTCRHCQYSGDRVVGRNIKIAPCPRCGLYDFI